MAREIPLTGEMSRSDKRVCRIANLLLPNKIKYTFIEDKTFFVNIMLQNARIFKNNFSLNEPGCLQKNVQINESIGAVIDINDRYAFNMHNNYESDSSTLNDLVEHMDNIINNKLELLIEKGEY